MTKAEEIYKATRKACQIIIERWGYDGFGLSELSHPYGEKVCKRTLNAVQDILNGDIEKHQLHIDTDTMTFVFASTIDVEVDEMVQKTINN